MKRFIILIAAFAVAFSAAAQQKGDMSLGGIIGVSGTTLTNKSNVDGVITKTKGTAPTKFSFSPRFSYFVVDGLELSAGLEYAMERNSYDDDDINFHNTTNIALFQIGVHYFVPIVKNAFYYTPGVDFGFGGGSEVTKGGSTKVKEPIPFAFGCAINLGKFEFRPSKHLGFSLNLLDLVVKDINSKPVEIAGKKIKNSETTLNVGFNYGASVGVRYYF